MKKRLNTIIAVILLVTSFVFTGCSKKVEPTDSSKVESLGSMSTKTLIF